MKRRCESFKNDRRGYYNMRKNELFIGQRVEGWTALRGIVTGTVTGWRGIPARVDIKLDEDAVPDVGFVQARGHAGYVPKVRKKGTIVDIGIINVTPIDIKPVEKKLAKASIKKTSMKAAKSCTHKPKKLYLAHNAQVAIKKSGILKGQTVYVTGKDAEYSKEELKNIVLANGGNWGWSAKTTLLVIAGTRAGPSKQAKVDAWGTKIISISEFLKMIKK